MRFAPSSLAVLAVLLSVGSPVSAETRCAVVPQADCRQSFVLHKSTLVFLQTGHTDPDDIYTWKWQFGSQTARFKATD